MRCGLAVLTACIVALPLQAQEHEAHRHSTDQLGRVSFPVSCTPEARRRFEHAMAVLHSFWWDEGDTAFRAVLAADPTCAMAQWGIALNAWGNPFAGGPTGPALAQGVEAATRAQVAAVAALYRNAESIPNAARLEAYQVQGASSAQRGPRS